ncbi:fructose-specific PTS transporter subunit EIIC [Kitasatospora azatica]|uniref:fructose-specific PTS transporter subunit EIIC n=1 Tax=Kitasatospora azatica TaxID=58347 RepID=UPI00068C7C93|nr:fructose-specific PTS transporter subunit EIIC [Kitasatospora azatica]
MPRRNRPTRAHRSRRSGLFGRQFGTRLTSYAPQLGPIVAIPGVMVVIALAVAGPHISETASQALFTGDWSQSHTWAGMLLKTGLTALSFLAVAVAAAVGHSVAGRSAVIPAALGGLAATGVQAGVLAGLAAGAFAGVTTLALQRVPVPPRLHGLSSTVLFPLVTTVATSFLVIGVVGEFLNSLSEWLHGELAGLEFSNAVAAGAVLGAMACADLGGMVTRTAIGFGSVELGGDPSRFSTLNMTLMAAVIAAGMVPGLALPLATLVRRGLFTEGERGYARTGWLLGAAFLPEGAIPFALADPLRVLPASMLGGAVTGALVMDLGATSKTPYGGVFALGETGRPLLFLLAVVAGVLTTTALTVGLKSLPFAAPARATATRLATSG